MELFVTFLAGISILVGALVVKLTNNKEEVEQVSMAMALTALLSLLIFDLLPEVKESAGEHGWPFMLFMILLGLFLLIILDRFVPEHEDTELNHDTGNAVHIGMIAALAIVVHNIVEGMTVYSMLFENFQAGVILAFGIALHNIPMGMMIYTTMIHQKRRDKGIVFGAVTLSTLLGGLIMFSVSGHLSEAVICILVAIATGMILYIVFWELFPHVLKTKGYLLNIIGAVLGFVLVFISSLIGG